MSDWGPFSLQGKNAIVTGGAVGIGWGVAERFVQAGANVLIADLEPDAAKAKIEALPHPERVATVTSDVTDSDAGQEMVDACLEAFGPVDILVNNAGIYPQVPMLEMDQSLFRKIIDINLVGLAYVTQAVAKHMVADGRPGKIVNMASIDGIHPSMVGLAAYDASKGGVVMFTKNLALELAPQGIHVNAIAPGGISTEGTANVTTMPDGMTPEQMQEMMAQFIEAKVPLRRMGDPDDIAKVAVFLASGASDYMTGEVVVVDGGTLLT